MTNLQKTLYMNTARKLLFVTSLCLTWCIRTDAQSVKYDSDGKLKIVQFTDVHWVAGNPDTAAAAANMNRVLDEEKPDLVIYTGDITTGKPAAEGLDKALEPVISRDIPYAVTFGNHDDEQDLTRHQLYDYIKSKAGCLNGETGGTDFAITVTSADGGEIEAVLYVMDSNAYSTIEGLEGYGWFRYDQIDWFINKSNELTAANGGTPLPALAFFHIPFPEYNEAASAESNPLIGQRGEKACAPAVNTGMFAAMLRSGSIMGTFVAHDHVNNYVTPWHGILLCYGQFTGGKTTYTDGKNGARVIELSEGQRGFKTWIRMGDGSVVNVVSWPEDFSKK